MKNLFVYSICFTKNHRRNHMKSRMKILLKILSKISPCITSIRWYIHETIKFKIVYFLILNIFYSFGRNLSSLGWRVTKVQRNFSKSCTIEWKMLKQKLKRRYPYLLVEIRSLERSTTMTETSLMMQNHSVDWWFIFLWFILIQYLPVLSIHMPN